MLSRWVVCLFLVLLLVGEVDEFVSVSRTHTRSASYIAVVSSYRKKYAEVADPRYVDCIPGDPFLWGHHLLLYVHKQFQYFLTPEQTIVRLNKYNLVCVKMATVRNQVGNSSMFH